MVELHESSLTAFILGIVEGVTEFLPVSSTGHLILFGDALQFKGPLASTFEIFIQLGAILAVVVLYFRRFTDLFDFSRPEEQSRGSFRGWSGLLKLTVACIPTFIIGYFLHDFVKAHLFNPLLVAFGLFVGSAIILIIESSPSPPTKVSVEELSYRDCFLVGLCQCFAMWPGISRSASTIIGAMMLGASRRAAAEFSFLLAVPTLCAAAGFDMLKNYHLLSAGDVKIFAIGLVTSFVMAVIAVKTFIGILGRFTLLPFAYYRIALGIVVILILFYSGKYIG